MIMIYQSTSPKFHHFSVLTAAIFALCFFSFAAYAQDESEGAALENILEEVVVTGTKRELSLQDIPMSISAITEKELAESPFNDVRALGTLAPGMVLSNPAGFNATAGGMRGTGVNIIIVTQDAPVSFLVDEFPLSHVTSQFLTLFDIQQIEVFRGPQGTLFGKNTTGGVIAINSKKPILGEYSGEAEFEYGAYNSDAQFYSVNAAINVPFGDRWALRVAVIGDFSDGYYTDDKTTATFPDSVPIWGLFGIPEGTPPPPEVDTTVTGTGRALGGKDVFAAKAKLLWDASDTFQAYLITEFVRDRSDSPPGVNESIASDLLPLLGFPGNALAGNNDTFSTLISHNDNIQMDQGHQVDIDGIFLHLDWDLSRGIFKSITGYREEEQIFPSTYTGESFKTLFDSTRNTMRETIQQEFRFVSQLGGPFEFVAGASYYHDEFDFLAFFSVGLTALLPVFDAETGSFVTADGYASLDTRALFDYQFQQTSQDRDQYAGYFDGTYDFGNDWRLTFGLRYSYDEKSFIRGVDGGGPCTTYTEEQDIVMVGEDCIDTRSQYISRANMLPREFDGWNVPIPFTNYGVQVNTKNDWDEPTYRLILDYTLEEGSLIYGSYSTGFVSGGFSETCATVSRCAYDPETNQNLEFGYKADLADNTVRFNAAAYYTKYEDLQRAVVANYTAADGTSQQETVTVNAGESRAIGVDIELDWIANENLEFKGALNWLDHEYTSGILPALREQDEPTPLEQFDVPFSPDWKASLVANYYIPMNNGGRVLLSGTVNYQGEAETDVFNGLNTQMESRTLIYLGVSYLDPEDRYTVTAFIDNVLDEEYRVTALPVAGLWNFTHYGAPLSYGVRFNARF
jgi:iron complex outermembrane receptor protein